MSNSRGLPLFVSEPPVDQGRVIPMNLFVRTWVMLIALALTLPATAAPRYSFSTLVGLGGDTTIANAINNSGRIAGWSRTPDGLERPAVWQDGVLFRPQEFQKFRGWANAINDQGVVAGASMLSDSTYAATIWTEDKVTILDASIDPRSDALAINNSGQVAGMSFILHPTAPFHAAGWVNGTTRDLNPEGKYASRANAIDGTGRASGGVFGPRGVEAAYWQDGMEVLLPSLGGDYTQVMAANEAGTMVGYSSERAGSASSAVYWKDEQIHVLGVLSQRQISQALGINDESQIVGTAHNGDFSAPLVGSVAVLWLDDKAIDLNDRLDPQAVAEGWVLHSAVDINNAGLIIGTARNTVTGAVSAYWLSPVPEPQVGALVMIGLVLLRVAVTKRGR